MRYTWKDIVLVDGHVHAEEFPISGKMDDTHSYEIDDFLKAVAKKYDVDTDDVKTYTMDDIEFDPKAEHLAFGIDKCGAYLDGIPEWEIEDEMF